MKIKELKKGDYFTLRSIENPKESQVYVRGDYDRSSRKYECSRFDDFCSFRLFSGSKEVFVDFVF